MKKQIVFLVCSLLTFSWSQVDGAFSDSHSASSLSSWEVVGARTWSVNNGSVSSADNGNQGMLLRQQPSSNEGTMVAELSTDAWNGDQLGLVFGYKSASDYYFLAMKRQNPGSGVLKLFKSTLSGTSVKEVGNLTLGDPTTIRLEWIASQLTIRVAGVAVLFHTDPAGFAGRVGYGHTSAWNAFGSILQSSFSPTYTQWTYSGLIHMNTSATGLNLTSDQSTVFVPVELGPADVQWGTMSATGTDLRFVDAQGMVVPYEIETWQPELGLAKIWLRLSKLQKLPGDYVIQAYWGQSDNMAASDANLYASVGVLNWHKVVAAQESSPLVFDAGLNVSCLFGSTSTVGRIAEIPNLFRLELVSPLLARVTVQGQNPVDLPITDASRTVHFSLQYASTHSVSIYMDGVLVQAFTNIAPPAVATVLKMKGEAWDGLLSEVRVGAFQENSRLGLESSLLSTVAWRNYELGGSGLLPPSDFEAVASGSIIELSWTDQSSDEDGFLLRIGAAPGAWTSTKTIQENETTTSIPLVSCGGPWYFELVSLRGQDESSPVFAGPIATAACVAELDILSAVGYNQMDVSWKGNSLVYELQSKKSEDSEWTTIYSGPSKTFAHENLSCETEYSYQVRSTDQPAYSLIQAEMTGLCPPALASNLIANASIPGQIQLQWTRNGVNPEQWEVYRKSSNQTDYILLGSPIFAGVDQYQDATVVCGESYSYKVRSMKNAVYSDLSAAVNATAAFCGADKRSRDLILVNGMAMNSQSKPFEGTKTLEVNLYTTWNASGTPVYTEQFPNETLRNGFYQVTLGLRGDALSIVRLHQNLYYTITVDGVLQDSPRALAGNAYSVVNEWALSGMGNPISLQVPAGVGATFVDTQDRRLFMKTGPAISDWLEFKP